MTWQLGLLIIVYYAKRQHTAKPTVHGIYANTALRDGDPRYRLAMEFELCVLLITDPLKKPC